MTLLLTPKRLILVVTTLTCFWGVASGDDPRVPRDQRIAAATASLSSDEPVGTFRQTGSSLVSDMGKGCADCGCDTCGGSCSSWWSSHRPGGAGTAWLQMDYLMWWTQGNNVPPLVTTSPQGTPLAQAGVLGQPGTQVLFGGQRIDENLRHGGRIQLGYWFNDCTAVEGHWFSVGDGANTGNYSNQSTGNPILARPFFDLVAGTQASQLIGFTGFVDGAIQIETNSELHSAGALLRRNLIQTDCGRLAVVGGYRFFRFSESLTIREALVSQNAGTGVAVGTSLDVFDQFDVDSDFHGGELGLAAAWNRGRFTLDLLGKVAVGNVHERLQINGGTIVTAPGGAPNALAGGLYALPSNIGSFSRDRFAFLPQLDVNLQYRVTPCFRLQAGYSLLFLTEVLRTGDQIDTLIDPTQLPITGGGTGAGPLANLDGTSMWVQGLNLGAVLEF